MVNAGQARPDNTAAHHIISATSPETKQAREILGKYLKDVTPTGEKTYNNEINGVFLPSKNNTDLTVPGITHNGRQPRAYNENVNLLIQDADIRGGWLEVKKVLETFKRNLLQANRNAKWENIP